MATIDVKDALNITQTIQAPNVNGRVAAASSRPVVLSTEDLAALQALLTDAQLRASPVPVSGTVALGAGAAAIGTVALTAGAAAIGSVTLGAGAAAVGTVAGAVAEDSAAGTSPLLVGGVIRTATGPTTLTTGDVARLTLSKAAALVVKPYAVPETDWHYAAASGGISNTTTAVTVKAAGGANVINYITAIDIMTEALGAATEIAIRDGAAGTVLWRTKIGTGGLSLISITFPNPLKGTSATLTEVVTLTASITGAVYVNVHGYQAL